MKAKLYSAITLMTACLPALVYIIWANAYYWLLEGGRYKAFLQPKLWPLLVLALILLLMFIAALISGFTRLQACPPRMDVWLRSAILFLPVFFLWSIYGQSLGGYAFAKRALNPADMSSAADAYPFPSSPPTVDASRMTLLDLVKNLEIFDGKQVTAEGMVYRAPDHDEKSFMLFRFAIICCAADAFPVGILVKHADSGSFSNDAWVSVAGLLRIETVNARQRPLIDAHTVRQIPKPPPENRYLFF
jgi:putative membrane protein